MPSERAVLMSSLTDSEGCSVLSSMSRSASSGDRRRGWPRSARLFGYSASDPEDTEDDRDRVAIGRVLAAAGKMYLRQGRMTEGKTRLEDAVGYYHAIRRPQAFASTHHADALIQLERFDEAVDVLEAVPEAGRESYWRLRRSEAHRAKKELQEALTCLDVALEDGGLGGRRATFLELRAGVLFDMRDLGFRDWFRRAIEASDSDKNTARLRGRLEALEGEAAGW